MILRLGTTEFLDWAECWCFRCEHDHQFSHVDENEQRDGCELLVGYALQTDVPEFEPRRENALSYLPAEVSCSKFKVCTQCPPDPPDAERRGGETEREFRDRFRAQTLARPVVAEADA